VSTNASVAALREQLESLEALTTSEGVEGWRNETKGVLRGVFKVSHPSIQELDEIRFFGPLGIDTFSSGKSEATGLLRGLIREVELSGAR